MGIEPKSTQEQTRNDNVASENHESEMDELTSQDLEMPEELVRIGKAPLGNVEAARERDSTTEQPKDTQSADDKATEMETEENARGGVKRGPVRQDSNNQKRKATQRSQSLEKATTNKRK